MPRLMDQQHQGTGQTGSSTSASVRAALWLIVILLAANAAILICQPGGMPAWAQGVGAAAKNDSGSVFVVPGQIDKNLYGAYLVDTRAGTIVLYQYNPDTRKLKLAAARSFVYDRYLESYNTDPAPSEIADLVAKSKRIVPGGDGGSKGGGDKSGDGSD